jgi:hypothetical protein
MCAHGYSNPVTAGGKDDRYGRGRCLRRQRWLGAAGYDHRYAAVDEIGCKRRQPIVLIFRPAVFDRNVLALDIAAFLEALKERKGENPRVISGLGAEEPDHRHRRLLRARRQRPRRCTPEPRDEIPPSH